VFFHFDRPKKNWDMLTSREQALKHAKTDTVLILDSDVYLRPGEIDRMAAYKEHAGVGWVTDKLCIPKDSQYDRVAQCSCLLIDRNKALRAISQLPVKERAIFRNGLEDSFITFSMRGAFISNLAFTHYEDIKKWYKQINVKKALKTSHPVLKPLLQYIYERERSVWDKRKK
jgi:glycosyltransferase involved in cell wall biosynthesis